MRSAHCRRQSQQKKDEMKPIIGLSDGNCPPRAIAKIQFTFYPHLPAFYIGVNRGFMQPGATYAYKPYTATVTEIDTRFNGAH